MNKKFRKKKPKTRGSIGIVSMQPHATSKLGASQAAPQHLYIYANEVCINYVT